MAAEHIIDIVVETKDNVSPGLDRTNKKLRGFEKSVEKTQARLKEFARAEYEVVLRAIDRITPAGSRVRETLRSITGRAYNVVIGAIDRTASKVREAHARLTALTSKVWTVTIAARNTISAKASGAVNGALQSVTGMGGQMLAGAGIGYGVYDTIKTYKNFEAQMATVKAISTSDMGAAEAAAAMDALTQKAREMGATTQFSATEAAKAFEYMGMAGWNTEQMIAGIAPVLNLALASGEDLAHVSDIVTDAMTALHIDTRGEDATKNIEHFTDVLAAAATHSNTNVGMMGEAFKYAAAPAGLFADSYKNAADLSNDVALALGLMANSGIKASMAGTALRSTLTRMGADTIPTANAMRMLGVSITEVGEDGTEKLKPLRSIFNDLRAKTKEGLSTEGLIEYAEALSGSKTRNKEALMAFADKLTSQGGKLSQKDMMKFGKMLAGDEALSGLLAIMTATDEDYQKLIDAVDNSEGTAAKMAATRADTLAGDFDILKSAWEDLQIEFMTGAGADGLRSFLQGLQEDINKFKEYISDGFDISDVGRLAMDIIVQLKNKFLELDGIGSVLAGGVLAGGLYKIINLGKKAYEAINGKTGVLGGKVGLPNEMSTVATMTVHAGTVIIHAGSVANAGAGGGVNLNKGGKGAAGAGAAGAGEIAGGVGKAGRMSKALSSGSKFLKGGGALAAIAAGIGIYDAYSTNEQAAAEAQYGVDTAQSDEALEAALTYQRQTEDLNKSRMGGAVGSGVGSLAGAWAGMEAGAAGGAAIGALFGGVGAAPGAAIGGFLGGIGGAIAGSELGESIGVQLAGIGEVAGSAWEGIKAGASETWDWISNGASQAVQYIGEQWNGFKDYVGNALSPVRMVVEDVINVIVGLGSVIWSMIKPYWDEGVVFISSIVQEIADTVSAGWQWIVDSAAEVWAEITELVSAAWESICEFFTPAGEWFASTVWQPISDFASAAWGAIRENIITAWDSACALWGVASAWFDTTVWQPISTAVDAARAAISDAFQTAYDFVTGLFSGIAGWFEENVIAPIRNKFEELRNIGSGITGLVGSGGGSEAPHAMGGIFHAPHRGIVAENGPEAIIPLNDRTRGLDILGRAATMMGVDFGDGTDGAMFDVDAGDVAPLSASVSVGNAPQSVSIDMGGISIPITISGSSMDAQSIVQAIRENLEDIADDIGGQLADKVASIFGNQAVMNAR